MFKQSIGILFLSAAAGRSALAQDAPPTGIVKTGSISLIRAEGKIAIGNTPPVESKTDLAAGGFVATDYSQYTPPATPEVTIIGPCTIVQLSTTATPPPTNIGITNLDAGPVLNLNGPNGTKQLVQTKGAYTASLGGGVQLPISIPGLPGPAPLFLDPGTYTVDNGSGGADVGPFSVSLTAPSPGFVWTNADSDLTIDRTAGVDIQFSGGDPSTNVYIQGSVTILDPTSFQVTGGAAFTCLVPNNGDFVVTSDVLSLLPATPAGASGPTSILAVGNSTQVSFTASGIDQGVFLYTAGSSRSVVYQ